MKNLLFLVTGCAFALCLAGCGGRVANGDIATLDIVDNAGSITDPKLKEIAATLKEDDNPVIVVAELKK